jgi:hypothetical protein
VGVRSPPDFFDDAPVCAQEIYPKRNYVAIVDAQRFIY